MCTYRQACSCYSLIDILTVRGSGSGNFSQYSLNCDNHLIGSTGHKMAAAKVLSGGLETCSVCHYSPFCGFVNEPCPQLYNFTFSFVTSLNLREVYRGVPLKLIPCTQIIYVWPYGQKAQVVVKLRWCFNYVIYGSTYIPLTLSPGYPFHHPLLTPSCYKPLQYCHEFDFLGATDTFSYS